MSKLFSFALMAVLGLTMTHHVTAEVVVKEISYEHSGQTLKGILAYDSSITTPRPGVLVVHEWWGLNDYVKSRAHQLAEKGYVAFALDMFGEGKVTQHPAEASKWTSEIRENQDRWVARALAGLKVLKEQPQVDNEQIAAIGYCFGGSTALQLAYHEPSLAGVVSYHGGLVLPKENSTITPKILVCHGAIDSMIPPAQVEAFAHALEQNHADYVIAVYSGAKHGFTNPKADEVGLDAIGYNKNADLRSQQATWDFFNEIFGVQK